ncbi:MAG: transcriptional regulator [Betaproteobacteria bacterium RIFCSPLOWO2_02_FULL_62_17]|nr:MAG: transcriptional regulator [Betaproteobacteria bacterium RIFCSPLOWO2_02_FULL_62_17]
MKPAKNEKSTQKRNKTAYPAALPERGYLRLAQIIGDPSTTPPTPALIPVKKSSWWAGVKCGRFPQPVRTLVARITAWRVEDIRALIAKAGE